MENDDLDIVLRNITDNLNTHFFNYDDGCSKSLIFQKIYERSFNRNSEKFLIRFSKPGSLYKSFIIISDDIIEVNNTINDIIRKPDDSTIENITKKVIVKYDKSGNYNHKIDDQYIYKAFLDKQYLTKLLNICDEILNTNDIITIFSYEDQIEKTMIKIFGENWKSRSCEPDDMYIKLDYLSVMNSIKQYKMDIAV